MNKFLFFILVCCNSYFLSSADYVQSLQVSLASIKSARGAVAHSYSLWASSDDTLYPHKYMYMEYLLMQHQFLFEQEVSITHQIGALEYLKQATAFGFVAPQKSLTQQAQSLQHFIFTGQANTGHESVKSPSAPIFLPETIRSQETVQAVKSVVEKATEGYASNLPSPSTQSQLNSGVLESPSGCGKKNGGITGRLKRQGARDDLLAGASQKLAHKS